MKETFLKMIAEAEKQNISFAELCRKFLQSNGKYQSIIKEYIIMSGKVPDVGPVAQATQAGFLILTQIEPYNLQEFLDLEPGFIPTKFRRYPFYNMANSSPATFLCALFLAGENQDKVSNFAFFQKAGDKIKEGVKNLGEWAKKTVDQAGDVFRKTYKEIKDIAGDVATGAKKVAFAPFRGAFLLLVRFNVFNLARQFNRTIIADRQTTKNFWENEIGGDFAQLVSAVNLGKKEMPILPGKSQTFNYSSLDPVSAGTTATVAAPVTGAAKAFLISMKPIVAKAAAAALKSKAAGAIGTGVGGALSIKLIDELIPTDEEKKQEENVEQSNEAFEQAKKDVEAYKKTAEEIAKNLGLPSGSNVNTTFPPVVGTLPGTLGGFRVEAPAKDNTMLYIIGGAAILLAVILGRK